MSQWGNLVVAIADDDPIRQQMVGRLARELGIGDVLFLRELSELLREERRERPMILLVDVGLASRQATELATLRQSGFLVVGLSKGEVATPELLARGYSAVLYDLVTAVDLARILESAQAILARDHDRERQRLAKLSVLRQAAGELLLLAELTPQWISQSLWLLQHVLDVPGLALWRIDWQTDSLVSEGTVGVPAEFVQELEYKAKGRARDLLERVLESVLSPIDMRPESTDPRLITDVAMRERVGFEAGFVVPIRRSGQIVALLSIYLAKREDFDRSDIAIYDAAAEALAVTWAVAEVRREPLLNHQLYRKLVEEQPVGLLLCDLNGTVRLANGAAARLLGYREVDRLLGARLPELAQPLSPLPWEEWCQRSVGSASVGAVVPVLTLDKRLRILEFQTRVVELPEMGGRWKPHLQLTLVDVTLERRRLMELELLHDLTRLVNGERNLEAAFALVADRLQREFGYGLVGLALLSSDGSRFLGRAVRLEGGIAYNEWRADRGVTGRAVRENRAQLVVNVREDPDYFDPQPDLPMESEVVAVLRRSGRPIGVLNIESRRGHRLDQEDLRLALNVAVHLELLMQQVELTEQLERQALSDPLTGLPNRRALMDQLRRLLLDRLVDQVALLLIDFDGFKALNDEKGHLFGDAVLQAVAKRLEQSLRPSDLLARYAGDEFVVVLPEIDPGVVVIIAERLRGAIADSPLLVGDQTVELTISLGIAIYPKDGETPDALLRSADEALYEAKQRGGNTVVQHGGEERSMLR